MLIWMSYSFSKYSGHTGFPQSLWTFILEWIAYFQYVVHFYYYEYCIFFWCTFLDPQLTICHSNTSVHIIVVLDLDMFTLVFKTLNWTHRNHNVHCYDGNQLWVNKMTSMTCPRWLIPWPRWTQVDLARKSGLKSIVQYFSETKLRRRWEMQVVS